MRGASKHLSNERETAGNVDGVRAVRRWNRSQTNLVHHPRGKGNTGVLGYQLKCTSC